MIGRSNLALSLLLAGATLGIYGLAFVLQTTVPALPRDFPLTALSYPARVGNVVVEDAEHLRFVSEGTPPGGELVITDATGAVYHATTVRRRSLSYLVVIAINGLLFWAVTNFIFAPRLDKPGVQSFFWIAFLYGLSIMIGGIYYPGDRSWLWYVMGYTQVAILAALPVLFLRLSLTFPNRVAFLDRVPWLMPALAAAAVGVVAWEVVAFHRYFMHPGPIAGARLGAPQAAADGLLVVQTAGGIAALAVRALRMNDLLRRRQLQWLLLGFAVGSAPYVFFRTLPSVFGLTAPIPNHVDRIFELAIPMSFVLVVVRHRFLDIDVILRRGLMYTMLAALAIILYLLAGLSIGDYIAARVSGRAGVLLLILGLAAGLAFRPLRQWIGVRVDRAFFSLVYDYDRAGQELRAALGTVGGQDELAGMLARRIRHILHPSTIAVIVRDGDEPRVAGDLPPETARDAFRVCNEQTDFVAGENGAREVAGMAERDVPGLPSMLVSAGVVVIAPIRAGSELLGLILLGRRRNERRYIDRDILFLDVCAGLAADALSRIELVQKVSAEQFERERLDEINRYKTEYLSHVSHDLRTPLSSIAWSSQNLADGVVGSLNERQREYVESIRVSSEHLSQLVANLLAVSRIDQVQNQVVLEPVQLLSVMEDVVTTMRPVAQQQGVAIELHCDTPDAVVSAPAGHLREVFTNLLDNAVRFSPPGSSVEISMAGEDDGVVEVNVRDHGRGIDPQVRDTIFERHTQGAQSPYSSRRGFGLGLHIARTYVEQMGGSISAENHPSGGALLVVRLPRMNLS